jgi:hypothetical protein
MTYHFSVPYVLFGISSLFATVALSFLPETLHKDLPDSPDDVEQFGCEQIYWSWNSSSKPEKQ